MNDTQSRSLLREPLLHFLLIGAALFYIYDILNEDEVADDIIISKAQIEHLSALWEKKHMRRPTSGEIDNMIEQLVREEVLVREALAMGLDTDDSFIRRRLAQKMEFITTDLATLAEPNEADLEEYLAQHSEQFEIPAQIDFIQIYINPDRYGDRSASIAEDLLLRLSSDDLTPEEQDSLQSDLTGNHMLDREYSKQTERSISRWFGSDFAEKLFDLPSDSWQGPVRSGYGLHLVFISRRTESRSQSLDAVREQVYTAWQEQQRKAMDTSLYEKLRARYEVVIER